MVKAKWDLIVFSKFCDKSAALSACSSGATANFENYQSFGKVEHYQSTSKLVLQSYPTGLDQPRALQ
jgi:hypothetical protein